MMFGAEGIAGCYPEAAKDQAVKLVDGAAAVLAGPGYEELHTEELEVQGAGAVGAALQAAVMCSGASARAAPRR